MKYIRVIQKHSTDCWAKNQPSPWSGIIKRSYYGNYAGRETRVSEHKWHVVSCNCTHCEAECVIHSKVLSDICSKEVEMATERDYSKVQFAVRTA